MTDKHDAEQRGEQHGYAPEPWWAGLGTKGAVTLIAIGAAVAAWIFLTPAAGLPRLPFIPDIPASGYYQAAKIAAIGLALLCGTALTHRGRSRSAAGQKKRKKPRDDD